MAHRNESVPRAPRATLANALTALRILLVPPLWALALTGRSLALGLGLLVASGTDVLDGFLARRQGATKLGSRLDTAADLVLGGSTFAWLALLRPDIVRAHATLFVSAGIIGLAAALVGWVRFHRIADLHLYSAKATGFLAYCFVILIFVGVSLPARLIDAFLVMTLLAGLEALLVVTTRASVDEHVGSILPRARDRSR